MKNKPVLKTVMAEIRPGSVIYIDAYSQNDYKIHGSPTSDNWKRPGKAPLECWCNISINGGIFGGVAITPETFPTPWVSSFGGEVWPGAWPELFIAPPRNNYACGPNTLTPLGLQIFSELAQEAVLPWGWSIQEAWEAYEQSCTGAESGRSFNGFLDYQRELAR